MFFHSNSILFTLHLITLSHSCISFTINIDELGSTSSSTSSSSNTKILYVTSTDVPNVQTVDTASIPNGTVHHQQQKQQHNHPLMVLDLNDENRNTTETGKTVSSVRLLHRLLNKLTNSDLRQEVDSTNLNEGGNSMTRNTRKTFAYGTVRKMNTSPRPDKAFEYTREMIIKQGRLKGIIRRMPAGTGLRDVDQYLGIPYASAPVGNGRFMPPGASPPWTGLKQFDTLSPVCPQNLPNINITDNISKGRYDQLKRLLPYLKYESEDCLYLNLYVPHDDGHGPHQKYPVIIYIHGESYEWNSGNPYDGSVLASYGNIIVVTLNYRLGILGFLKPGLGEHTVSNFGLLDQVAALQWVKDNIAIFGGNPKLVTIMGHSTGAAFVNLLMISPVAKGLFRRAILMSGSALSDWAMANHPTAATIRVARELNCPLRNDNEEMLRCLRTKHYEEILKTRESTPQFSTTYGPLVDNSIIPDRPAILMNDNPDVFRSYDLLFGVTEIESYHNLNSFSLTYGLLEHERDNYLGFYMQNRYHMKSEIALAYVLNEYKDIYSNPERPQSDEHKDLVLEVLSDARVVAPIIQTGFFHSRNNPTCYMYVFGHNSRAGEFSNLPQSVVGEELPYIFGAPLAAAGPFPTRFSPEERLFSEAIMIYWTNFAKTGNPKAPWPNKFLSSIYSGGEQYDIDWPEFNKSNQSYLNLGIPPVINYKYRSKYINFWNNELPMELERNQSSSSGTIALTSGSIQHGISSSDGHSSKFGELPDTGSSPLNVYGTATIQPTHTTQLEGHPVYYADKTQRDPIREIKYELEKQLNHNSVGAPLNLGDRDDYSTQVVNGNPTYDGEISNRYDGNVIIGDDNERTENEIIVKADGTLNVLIAIIVLFVIVNLIIFMVYIVHKRIKQKLCSLTARPCTVTTEDDLKAGKLNDGEDSFIMDMIRKSANDYDPPPPIKTNMFFDAFRLTRQYSTSTMDANTKVNDWMAGDTINQSHLINPMNCYTRSKSPLNYIRDRGRGLFSRQPPEKISVAIDATPGARGDSILRQEPIELTKQKSFDYEPNITGPEQNKIVFEEINVNMADIDRIDEFDYEDVANGVILNKITEPEKRFEHKHSRSDPVEMTGYGYHRADDITSFIDTANDVNVTSRDSVEREPLSPEESLRQIQRINCPKVLPNYPNDIYATGRNISTLMKRRSLQPNYFSTMGGNYQLGPPRIPPMPPPRTTSTLDRRIDLRRGSQTLTTSPLELAQEPPEIQEPTITQNTLHYGPIVPKDNSIYSTLGRRRIQIEHQTSKPDQITEETENRITPTDEESRDEVDCKRPTLLTASIPLPLKTNEQSDKISGTTGTGEHTMPIEKRQEPKIIIKPTKSKAQLQQMNKNIPRVHAPPEPLKPIILSSSPRQSLVGTITPSKIPTLKNNSIRSSESLSFADSTSSSETSSSAETVKKAV